jgi:MarR family transcriptional regulator, lower aerobic nicotinate degradation pathway regulator
VKEAPLPAGAATVGRTIGGSLVPMANEPDVGPAPARIRDRPTWLISRTYGRSNRILNEAFARSGTGLRGYHYRLLAGLDESGPSSQADLSRATGVDRSDVVSVLGDLEQAGLIERAVDPENRRRNIVTLTRAGKKQLKVLDRVVDGAQERVMEPLSAPEQARLLRLLHRLGDPPA